MGLALLLIGVMIGFTRQRVMVDSQARVLHYQFSFFVLPLRRVSIRFDEVKDLRWEEAGAGDGTLALRLRRRQGRPIGLFYSKQRDSRETEMRALLGLPEATAERP